MTAAGGLRLGCSPRGPAALRSGRALAAEFVPAIVVIHGRA
jgi:hypothetical protein